jgi:hypothetical protein
MILGMHRHTIEAGVIKCEVIKCSWIFKIMSPLQGVSKSNDVLPYYLENVDLVMELFSKMSFHRQLPILSQRSPLIYYRTKVLNA